MSIESIQSVTCPECGNTQEFMIFESLNADLDPEAKKQLIQGTLFDFQCEKCGHTSHVNYPILYHDMTHKVMAYYVNPEQVEKTAEALMNVDTLTGNDMTGYRRRVVTSQNELREKAIIFDCELDDRIIEIIKLIYLAQARSQFPEANFVEARFMIMDGKQLLVFIGDESVSAELDPAIYAQVQADFAERLEKAGDNDPVVDVEWVSRFLND